MAKDNYQSIGALKLNTITPIIRAFFSGFGLDEKLTDEGYAQISSSAKSSAPLWADVLFQLHDLAYDLDLEVPPLEESFVGDYLPAFAKLYGAENDPVLADLISSYQFTDYAELEIAFQIAERLNDGHGLQGLAIEGAWETGGIGAYYSRNVAYSSSSTIAIDLGASLDKELAAADIESASGLVQGEVQGLLAAIQDESTRDLVSQKLAIALAQQLPTNLLTNILRQRGQAVSVWSKDDAMKVVDHDVDARGMSDDAKAQMAGTLLDSMASDLEEHLAMRGSEFLEYQWAGLKAGMVDEAVEEEPAAPQPA